MSKTGFIASVMELFGKAEPEPVAVSPVRVPVLNQKELRVVLNPDQVEQVINQFESAGTFERGFDLSIYHLQKAVESVHFQKGRLGGLQRLIRSLEEAEAEVRKYGAALGHARNYLEESGILEAAEIPVEPKAAAALPLVPVVVVERCGCGRLVTPEDSYCTDCGAKAASTSRFCGKCGGAIPHPVE